MKLEKNMYMLSVRCCIPKVLLKHETHITNDETNVIRTGKIFNSVEPTPNYFQTSVRHNAANQPNE